MNGAWRRLDDWYRGEVPAARLAVLRIVVGGYALIYLLTRAQHLWRPVDYPVAAFAPVGVTRLLSAPLGAGWVYAAWGLSVLLAGAFLTGTLFRATAPAFAAALLWVLSYRHSWGMVFHTDNLLVLHVAVLAFSPADAALALGPSGVGRTPRRHRDTVSGWALRATSLVTVASYLVAGVAKLEASGLHWAAGDVLRQQIAYDALRKSQLGGTYSPLGPWLLRFDWLFGPLSAFSLAAELLAPLALLGGRWAKVWCVAAWLFHVGVLALMAIAFAYPLSGCAFASFFALERWLASPAISRLRARVAG